jgi:hypothetical protein
MVLLMNALKVPGADGPLLPDCTVIEAPTPCPNVSQLVVSPVSNPGLRSKFAAITEFPIKSPVMIANRAIAFMINLCFK